MKKLNVGLIGYGFMGRAHSNAFAKVNHFFDLDHQVVRRAVCARDGAKVKAFAARWGYESVETDWRKLIKRDDIDLIDIATRTTRTPRLPSPPPKAGKWILCEKAALDERSRRQENGGGNREGQGAKHGLV